MATADDTDATSVDFSPPSSSIRHYSLMNSLLNVLNTTDSEDLDNVLARYFLEHFDSLHELNVYDVAEACYTSRSGIRRFCQSIGCDNFSDLKSYSWEWSRHRALFGDFASHDDFRSYLSGLIANMTEDVNSQVPEEDLDRLAACIFYAHEVVLLTSDFSSMAVREFQQSMLYLHKIVRIITDSFGDLDCLESLESGDLIIVVSMHGGYARAVLPGIQRLPCCKVLIAASHDEALAGEFDDAFHLSSEDCQEQRSVYAQYGVSYFFDLLYNRYHLLFGDEGERAGS